MDFVKLFAEVGGLSVFIFAAVAQLKQFGLAGKWLTGSAYAVGLVFGGALMPLVCSGRRRRTVYPFSGL